MAHPDELYDQLVAAAPELHGWRQRVDDYRDVPSVLFSLLAEELAQLIQARGISVLQSVAPVLERLSHEPDDDDAFSIGFMETFQERVEASDLDTILVRATLGPATRLDWEGAYRYRHQLDWCQIDFDPGHLEGPVRTPAHLAQWTHTSGDHVPANEAIARIRVADADYDLRLRFGCYTGRRGPSNSQALGLGWMLLVVLPDTDAHRKPSPPFGKLTPI